MKELVSKNLKHLRVINKLTQTDAAKGVGITQKAWASYEEYRAEPKINTIINIAKYFAVSIDDILTRDIKENPPYKNAGSPK